nr:IPT/TIG domain-containing protein [Nitrospiraceae bacterium]
MKNHKALKCFAVFLLLIGFLSFPFRDHFTSKTYGQTEKKVKKSYQSLAIDEQSDKVFAVMDDKQGIDVIDAKTGNILATALAGWEIKAVAIDEQRRLLAAADEHNKAVYLLSLDTLKTIGTVPLKEEPTSISIDPPLGMMIATTDDNEAAAIDMNTYAVVKEIKISDKPVSTVIDPALHLAVIAHKTWGVGEAGKVEAEPGTRDNVTIVDLTTLSVVKTLQAGKEPVQAALNPSTHEVSVADSKSNDITVIDLNTFSVKKTIPSGKHPGALSYNKCTNALTVVGGEDKSWMQIIDTGTGVVKASYAFDDKIEDVKVHSYINRAFLAGEKGLSMVDLPNPLPVLTSIAPEHALRGSKQVDLTINGQGLLENTGIDLNGVKTASLFLGCGSIKVTVPGIYLQQTGDIGIKAVNPAPGGGASNLLYLHVVNPVPQITGLDPASATAGTASLTVSVLGTGFFNDTVLTVNGVSRTFTLVSRTNIQLNLTAADLANGGYLKIVATNLPPGGGDSNTMKFTVLNPLPVLNGLNTATVPAGRDATITIAGSGFVPSTTVSVDGSKVNATFVSSSRLKITLSASLLTAGTHSITISNPAPGGGVSAALTLIAIPPDPATVAPPVDTTVATTMSSSTSFLYSGSNPIQTGVAPGTIEVARAAVIRGNVYNQDGSALSGVTITILNHPEFGCTWSRANGAFDMAVNGGDALTVNYAKPGYLPVQRRVNVPWQDYAHADDVVMIQADTAVNPIDLSSAAPIQVARANPITDARGMRRATLFFNQGTTATMIMPDGTSRSITSLTVRPTEFTVGDNGPKAMPGPLPANVGYTYAIQFVTDEELPFGATTIRFSKPVISYTENFLKMYVGQLVPVASYDPDRGAWIPSDNGRVIAILNIANGTATIDVNGNGLPATQAELAGLGVTVAELQQLAVLYQPGQSLWRAPIPHFTRPYDINWNYVCDTDKADCIAPNQPNPYFTAKIVDAPTLICPACVIEAQNQTLGENIKVGGTPFSLNYRSSVQRGRTDDYELHIPLAGANMPRGVLSVNVEITMAGQTFTQSFAPAANRTLSFNWNSVDVYGRPVQGNSPISYSICYSYPGRYVRGGDGAGALSMSDYDRIFGHWSYYGLAASGDPASQSFSICQDINSTMTNPTAMGHWTAQSQGFGGWTLSIQHAYDPVARVLYLGDGGRRTATGLNSIISTFAGDGQTNSMNNPSGVAADGKGNIYVADKANNKIKKIDPSGNISTIAGSGNGGFGGDGGMAVNATLNGPSGVSTDSAGNIYIADTANNRIRMIDARGIINTIAGNGQAGYSGDSGPATTASLNGPTAVAADNAGNIYIADASNNRIRMIDPAGHITGAAGNGQAGFSGDGLTAQQAALNVPTGVAVDRFGNIYIADQGNNRIRKMNASGIISTIAGNGDSCIGTNCPTQDGGPAVQTSLFSPSGVAVDASGNLFIADMYHGRIRMVNSTGTITTAAGNGKAGYSGDNSPASAATLYFPTGVAADPVGNVYIADSGNNRVRAIKGILPGVSVGQISIPSGDGKEVYIFDAFGRHQSTVDALTGAIIHSFGYDSNGYLISVTDRDGNVTVINRDSTGRITSITAPGGQKTTFALNANGYLASATDPAGIVTSYNYTAGGLLASEVDPKGNNHSYSYDNMGILVTDKDAAGGALTLSRTGASTNFTVSLTTAMGLTSTYQVETSSTRIMRRTDIDPQGARYVTVTNPDGSSIETSPDGTVTSTTKTPDPRLGMFSPVIGSMTVTTPGGLKLSLAETRTVSFPSSSGLTGGS